MPRRGRSSSEGPSLFQRHILGALARTSRVPDALPAESALCAVLAGCTVPPSAAALTLPADRWALLHAISAAAEDDLSSSHRKALGAVYTPRPVATAIVQQALDLWHAEGGPPDRLPIFFDPAAGAGAFLLSALQVLCERGGLDAHAAVAGQLRGGDISARSVQDTRAILEVALLLDGALPAEAVRAAAGAVSAGDFLLAEALPDFDILVGNPPYVRLQDIPIATRRQYEAAYADIISGSYSTAVLFIDRIARLLSGRRVAGLITQNNVFTSLAAEPLRRRLQAGGHLRRVIDFGHRQVFARASAYTCLLFLGAEARDALAYGYQTDVGCAALPPLRAIPAARLAPQKWRLGYPQDLDNIERIERDGQRLGDIVRIAVGFATLKDRVFFVEAQDDGTCLGRLPDGRPVPVEAALTRPAIRVADFEDEASLRQNRRRILYPYEKQRGRMRPLPWDRLQQEAPQAAAYLLAWQAALHTRSKGRLPAAEWYLWGRSQSLEAPGPKLLTKTFSRTPTFWLDETDSLFCNGYSLRLRPQAAGWTTAGLQRILRSTVMRYYACITSFSLSGGYQCYQKNFIQDLGLPPLPPDQRPAVADLSDAGVVALYRETLGLDVDAMLAALARYDLPG